MSASADLMLHCSFWRLHVLLGLQVPKSLSKLHCHIVLRLCMPEQSPGEVWSYGVTKSRTMPPMRAEDEDFGKAIECLVSMGCNTLTDLKSCVVPSEVDKI